MKEFFANIRDEFSLMRALIIRLIDCLYDLMISVLAIFISVLVIVFYPFIYLYDKKKRGKE
jgi:hypothetical protein